ncbi:exopolysaccharide production repressor protein [Neorhizobium sp. SHOUNA12B]|uniref:exopolysaccharide production repressor protein n=1 Tax=Neorhizobium sp. SHOUNA12B TaxID=2908928 RepID=UPI00344CC594
MSLLLRKSVKSMAPAALAQMTIASIVFGIITYDYQGDFLNSLVYTSLCFLLMQAGYFAGIFYMVWSEFKRKSP